MMSLEEILNKEQYRIKLGIKTYLCSGINIAIMLCIYLFIGSAIVALTVLVVGSLFAYRFIFNLTKDGGHYRTFLAKKAESFLKNIRKR